MRTRISTCLAHESSATAAIAGRIPPVHGLRRWRETSVFLVGFAMPFVVTLVAVRLVAWIASQPDAPRHYLAEARARELVAALDHIQAMSGSPAGPGDGLAALGMAMRSGVPTDPWGHPFVPSRSGDRRWPDVLSYGADGKPGGRGADADVSGRFGTLRRHSVARLDNLWELAVLLVLLALGVSAARSRWAAGALAGSSMLGAVVIVTTVRFSAWWDPVVVLSGLTAIAGASAALGLFHNLPRARMAAVLSAALACPLLRVILSGN